ncbi:hypothetical protein, partial [Streptococcus sobrinus]
KRGGCFGFSQYTAAATLRDKSALETYCLLRPISCLTFLFSGSGKKGLPDLFNPLWCLTALYLVKSLLASALFKDISLSKSMLF